MRPASVAAGEEVSLIFPEQQSHGLLYLLKPSSMSGKGFLLTSSQSTSSPPTREYFVEGDSDAGADSILISGQDGGRIFIPEQVLPGSYALCTQNSPRQLCGTLQVTN